MWTYTYDGFEFRFSRDGVEVAIRRDYTSKDAQSFCNYLNERQTFK